MKKIIGITGGIGSGKTTVCRYLQSLGYEIYIADDQAKKVMNQNPQVIESLTQLFGKNAYLNGELNRPYISSMIFQNVTLLQKMNQIVHPAVKLDFQTWVANIPADYPHELVVREAAILFEADVAKDCWKVITVYAPKTVRLQRATLRDKTEDDAILKKMANQWADINKIQKSDYVVINDGVYDWKTELVKILDQWQEE